MLQSAASSKMGFTAEITTLVDLILCALYQHRLMLLYDVLMQRVSISSPYPAYGSNRFCSLKDLFLYDLLNI